MDKGKHQPKKHRDVKVHGFMKRMATVGGRRVLKRRKLKGRHSLTAKAKV